MIIQSLVKYIFIKYTNAIQKCINKSVICQHFIYTCNLHLIVLTISNPAIACSKYIHKFSNSGHELILSPTAASMLNLLYPKIIKVYTYLEKC